MRHLPLVTLYLSERCNSRCVTCDYWQHGSVDMSLESVSRLLPSLVSLHTKTVLISGGEPLLNPEWEEISVLLRAKGLTLWLLTSGLSLAKHVTKVAEVFHRVTVSLDGTDRATYKAIRGLDAFDTVCRGIRMATDAGIPVGLRITVQRDNFKNLTDFVRLAQQLRVQEISFLAADVANPHVFGRNATFTSNVALHRTDLPVLEQTLQSMESECAEEFANNFIAESPGKLRRILQYYSAICGRGSYPPVRCNAPEFSAVIEADGRLRPCFFISGPPDTCATEDLGSALNATNMAALRSDIRCGRRPECVTCVCSMWRDGEPYV
jgi:MoaA/NifB/PqqE/SkfB family radical SAM enzyme